jgi:hypothetical protein
MTAAVTDVLSSIRSRRGSSWASAMSRFLWLFLVIFAVAKP